MGIAAGTTVRTLAGDLPVEHLAAGDRIVTRSGASRLNAITSVEATRVVRIARHALGQGRPRSDTMMGPEQRLRLREVQVRVGEGQVEVPMARLVDGRRISAVATPVRLFRLEFSRDEVIYAGGLEVMMPGPAWCPGP